MEVWNLHVESSPARWLWLQELKQLSTGTARIPALVVRMYTADSSEEYILLCDPDDFKQITVAGCVLCVCVW
jgi:hypothetical protein